MNELARQIMALKLQSVLSYRVAMRRNSLILQKKFSMRWRHAYVSKSQSIGRFRFCFGGMTAAAPLLSSSVRIQSMSKALSPSKALKAISSIKGETAVLDRRSARQAQQSHGPGRKDDAAEPNKRMLPWGFFCTPLSVTLSDEAIRGGSFLHAD